MAILRTRGESGGAESVERAVMRLKHEDREELRGEQILSIDYFKNRMRKHVESELLDRFPASQDGDGIGQEIFPVMFPITERYVKEQATAYNGAVERRFVDDDGKESEATKEQTEKFNKALGPARYDETLHANDQMTVLLRTMGVLPQIKRGQLALTTHYPYTIFPIAPEDAVVDVSDPDDYDAFVLELTPDQEDLTKDGGKLYAYLSDTERVFYRGFGIDSLDKVVKREKNTLAFMHADDSGKMVDKPGRMLTFWHNELTPDELIVMGDATVARMNHEINILFSVLFDMMRFQGNSTPVINSADASTFSTRVRWGARFPVLLGPKGVDDFKYATANVPYEAMTSMLQDAATFFMLMLRASPGDFAVDAPAAESGFAKLVASLPKLEARKERIRALTWTEEYELSPRVVGVLVQTGQLDAVAKKMRLLTTFADVEFPMTPDERAKELETDMKYNLTTAAKMLAEKKSITVEEAEEEIKDNAEKNKQANPAQSAGGLESGLSALIAQRKPRGAKPGEEDDNAQNGPDGNPSRQDRPAGGPAEQRAGEGEPGNRGGDE